MIPLGTLATVEREPGPQIITRYNLYPSASITGEAAPGFSSGQALDLMEQMAAEKLPAGDGLRVDRHVVPGEAGRLPGGLRLRAWPSCWSTSSWPRSTRAGSRPPP